MAGLGQSNNGEVPTVLVRDSQGSALLCFLEQLITIEGVDYGLLTPVDTPVSLFRLSENGNPELIEKINSSEPILEVADIVLQEHDLTLVRSAVTLTITGELDEPEPEELEEDEIDDDSETYELLVNFRVKEKEYGLYIPLDPFFVVAKLKDSQAELIEGQEFDKLQPLIERELEIRERAE
tara:strand:- start:578 stop:1120 length:543 start_codon:yes stop_codon:yes gene_type:complete